MPHCRNISTSQVKSDSSPLDDTEANGGHNPLAQESQPPRKKRSHRSGQVELHRQTDTQAGAATAGSLKNARKSNAAEKGGTVMAGAQASSPRRRRQQAQVCQAAQGRPASSESNGLSRKTQAGATTAGKNKAEKPTSLGSWHSVATEPTTKALEPDVVIKLLKDDGFCPGARPITFSPDLGKASSWIFKEGEHFHTRRKAASGEPVSQGCNHADRNAHYTCMACRRQLSTICHENF